LRYRFVGSKNISKVEVTGVATAIGKHSGDAIESKGVKAHFSMDESGIFSLSLVESVFEKNSTVTDDEDTLSKIGSAFSKLFSGSTDEKPNAETDSVKTENDDSTENKKAEETATPTTEDSSKKTDDSKNNNKSKKVEDDKKVNATAEAAKKNKTVLVKESLQKKEYVLDITALDGEQMKMSSRK